MLENFLKIIQSFLIKNKKNINKMFKLWWVLVIAWFILTTQIKNLDIFWQPLGKLAATTSIISFWLTLIPGIMKRLRINKPSILLTARTLLMLYRRELGITMWVFAMVHYGWSRVLPILAIGGNLLDVSLFETMGFLAFVLATPLFLTSNDLSQHGKFRNAWKWLHRLVYIIIWLLFLHVALQEIGTKAIITLGIALLEITSLVIAWKNKAKNLALQSQS